MYGGRVRVLLGTAAVALLTGGSALGATPQQVYKDLADNGKLDKQYSRADLQRAARNAALQGYNPTQQPAGAQLKGEVARQRGGTLGATATRGGLPFTGLDLALLAFGGGALLIAGTAMRRLARARR
jgi:hypothetical protein